MSFFSFVVDWVPLYFFLIFIWFVYFLPTFVAFRRRVKLRRLIFVINLFLGFSVVGYFIAGYMASTGECDVKDGV